VCLSLATGDTLFSCLKIIIAFKTYTVKPNPKFSTLISINHKTKAKTKAEEAYMETDSIKK
jgi:hypothetical protein